MTAQLIRKLTAPSDVEQSTRSRALGQPESKSLIQRETDAPDHRAVRVFITEAGRSVFETLWPRVAEARSRKVRGVSGQKQRDVVGILQKMLYTVRKHGI